MANVAKWLEVQKPGGPEDCNGFLDRQVKLEGTLEVSGIFRIDGEVKGRVHSTDRLILGESARLEGEIECKELSVAGKVNGNIRATGQVEILPCGEVEGELYAPSLIMEAGGVLQGHCHMPAGPGPGKPGREPVQPASETPPPQAAPHQAAP
jgi:cytoskeletal protein CcmA (bactofilin family)